MLDKLLESLDKNVFTPDTVEKLKEEFNEAVELESNIRADELVEDKIVKLDEKSEKHVEFLEEKAEEYIDQYKEELLENLDSYLDRVVSEFLSEAQDSLEESVTSKEADVFKEAFKSMLVTSGLTTEDVNESTDENLSEEVKSLEEKYNTVVNEIIDLKEENENLIRMGVISEMSADMSIVEKEKFERLAEMVEFVRDESYTKKLEMISESIVSKSPDEEITETVKPEKDLSTSWSHLI